MSALKNHLIDGKERCRRGNVNSIGNLVVPFIVCAFQSITLDSALAEQFDLECVGVSKSLSASGSIRYDNYETTKYVELDIDEKTPIENSVKIANDHILIFHNRKTDSRCDNRHLCSIQLIVDARRISGSLVIEFPSISSKQTASLNLDRVSGSVSYVFQNHSIRGPEDGYGFSGKCKKKTRVF